MTSADDDWKKKTSRYIKYFRWEEIDTNGNPNNNEWSPERNVKTVTIYGD